MKTMKPDLTGYRSISDVSRELGASRTTIHRWIEEEDDIDPDEVIYVCPRLRLVTPRGIAQIKKVARRKTTKGKRYRVRNGTDITGQNARN